MLGCSMLPRGCYSKACVSLVAKISCQVHLISWRDLAEVMKVYPEIKERILEEMELSCNLSSTKMVCAKMKFFSIELLIVALIKPIAHDYPSIQLVPVLGCDYLI